MEKIKMLKRMFTKNTKVSMRSQGYTGFSLAEVLIALGVIGIVAAITIPPLVTNYKKSQYVASLKKFYTTFNQALQLYAAENGSPGDIAGSGLFDTTDETLIVDRLAPYLKIAKNCGTGQGCFSATITSLALSPLTGVDANTNVAKVVLADGTAFNLNSTAAINCTNTAVFNAAIGTYCMPLAVDTNGRMPPNQWGRDVFQFDISSKGILYPRGAHGYQSSTNAWDAASDNACNPSVRASSIGYNCAGRIIEQGWEMNY